MRISKSDYESRILVEKFVYSIADIIRDKHDISQDEFIGRLIVSKLNALQIGGVFQYADSFRGPQGQLNALQIGGVFQYVDVRSKTLFLVLLEKLNVKNISLIEDFLKEQLKDYSKKYNDTFNLIELLNVNGIRITSVSLDAK